MPFSASADSNRVQLSYVAEVTPGVTPATPQLRNLRMTSESLNTNIATSVSNEIRSDRNVADVIKTGSTAGGDINVEYSFGEYDELLEAFMQGTWAANVLKNGSTRRSFTIQKAFTDKSKYQYFRGCEVTTMSMDLTQGAIVTGAFGILARTSEDGAIDLDPTPTASLTNSVFNTGAHFKNFKINGTSYSDGVRKVAFNATNTPREQRQMGTTALAGVGIGRFNVSGSFETYFGDATVINDSIANDTYLTIAYDLDIAGVGYTISFPKVKATTRTIVAGGVDQDVVLNVSWQAVADANGVTMQVTRKP